MAKASVYSYSKLKCYEQCRWQFAERYGNKHWIKAQSIEAFVGQRVHDVVEAIHKGACRATTTEAWDLLLMKWDELFNDELFDVRDRGADWWRDHAMRCVSNFLRVGLPPERSEVVGIEYRAGAPLSLSPMLTFTGILDRLIRFPDGRYEIHDFKTGRVAAQRYFEADKQFPLYAKLVERHFLTDPSAVITCRRIYLAPGEIQSLDIDSAWRDEVWEWAVKTSIEAQHFLAECDIEKPRTTVSALCDWCGFKYKNCPEFNKETSGDDVR
jgi:RecB family exonuclease